MSLWFIVILRILTLIRSAWYSVKENNSMKFFRNFLNYVQITVYSFTLIYVSDYSVSYEDNDQGQMIEHTKWFRPNLFTRDMYVKNHTQQVCGSIAILLSWLTFLLYIRQFPKFGVYVLMFTHITSTFTEFFVVLAIFIIAFSSTFTLLVGNKVPFHTSFRSFISTLTMMIGEFEFEDKFLSHINTEDSSVTEGKPGPPDFTAALHYNEVITLIIYAAFVVIMSIIVMNMITGLAVDDIDKIRRVAEGQKISLVLTRALEKEFIFPMSRVFPRRMREYLKAKKLLGNRAYHIVDFEKEVTNYENQNAFSRFFRDETDVIPKTYKQAIEDPTWLAIEDPQAELKTDLDLIKVDLEKVSNDLKKVHDMLVEMGKGEIEAQDE